MQKTRKQNSLAVFYEITIKYGYNDTAPHTENGDVFGVNWDNVKSVSGQTYDLRSEIKDRGFRWDGKNKRWC